MVCFLFKFKVMSCQNLDHEPLEKRLCALQPEPLLLGPKASTFGIWPEICLPLHAWQVHSPSSGVNARCIVVCDTLKTKWEEDPAGGRCSKEYSCIMSQLLWSWPIELPAYDSDSVASLFLFFQFLSNPTFRKASAHARQRCKKTDL